MAPRLCIFLKKSLYFLRSGILESNASLEIDVGGRCGHSVLPDESVDTTSVDGSDSRSCSGVEDTGKGNLAITLAHEGLRARSANALDDFIDERDESVTVVQIHLSEDVIGVESVRLGGRRDGWSSAFGFLVIENDEPDRTAEGGGRGNKALEEPVQRFHRSLATDVLCGVSALGTRVEKCDAPRSGERCGRADSIVDELELRTARHVLEHRSAGDPACTRSLLLCDLGHSECSDAFSHALSLAVLVDWAGPSTIALHLVLFATDLFFSTA